MAVVRIAPESQEYQQFARLYAIARRQFPSQLDRWNKELYATVGEPQSWGSLQRDGSFKLSKELVLDRLAPGAMPHEQVQALTTVLHESMHARVEIDAPHEPNAVASKHSKALDEGLTEWAAVDGVAVFADEAGYGQLPDAEPEYSQAYYATNSLLEYAAGPEGAQQLANRAIDRPVVMRWDVIADEIVRNRLGDVVPADPAHQQAARAELINAMTQPGWLDLHQTRANVGPAVAQETTQALDEATDRIREHHAKNPSAPYPAKNPNFRVAHAQAQQVQSGPQERVISRGGQVDLTKLPPPNPATRMADPRQSARPGGRQDEATSGPSGPRAGRSGPRAGRSTGESAPAARNAPGQPGSEMRFLSGSAPAAMATQHKPDLGDGARGAGASRPGVERVTPTPDRSRD